MPWGRLDDGLYDHPKLDKLGRDRLPAVGLWTLAISWCNRRLTDGHVPADRVRLLGGTKALADRLVTVGMFEACDDGYLIHDFLTFNDSREHVEARREADRNRKRKPNGLQPETDGTPIHATRGRAGRVAPAGGRPGPAYTDSRPSDSPQPPAGGGRPSRANGTSPRQAESAEAERSESLAKARRWRAQQRQLAYYRGALTVAQLGEMNEADAPLSTIPDWAEYQASQDAQVAS